MKNLTAVLVLATLVFAGCGDDGGEAPAVPPSVPEGLSAEGSLGQIELTWEASTGGGLRGYNVYRSKWGGTYTKLNEELVPALRYQDTTVEDGVSYLYRVTAVGGAESDFSDVVRQMPGTRLLSRYDSGCVLEADTLNPYVAEDTVTVAGGHLEIRPGANLHVMDNALIDLELEEDGGNLNFEVDGLLRIEAWPTAPARITAHMNGGELPDGRGFALQFDSETVDYDQALGTGTVIQNCYIENLRQGDAAISMEQCSVRFYNCKISSNKATGGSYFYIGHGAVPDIRMCRLDRIAMTILTDLRGKEAVIARNRMRDGYYTLYFLGPAGPGMVDPGQVVHNDFDGTVNGLYMYNVPVGDIPLADNYWHGGVPEVLGGGGTPVFTPVLDEPPQPCGPTW